MKRNLLTALLLAFSVAALAAATVIRTQAGVEPKSVRIIYSNDTVGYLEPCGCGGRYQGGLARRATAILQLKKENPSVVIVDSGNLSDKREKLGLITRLMADMGYVAVGIGETDVSHLDTLLAEADSSGIAVLDASGTHGKSTSPYLVKKVNGVRVGLVSFGRNCTHDEQPSLDELRSFYAALKQARESSDLLVLMDQGGIATREWLEKTSPRLGTPDVVIGGIANVVMTKTELVGKTYVVPTSLQGKRIGVIDVSISSGQPIISAKMVRVDKATPEDEVVKKKISEFVLRPAEIRGQALAGPGADEQYVDPETCKGCHADEYEQWQRTDHASAIRTLVTKNRLVPECESCHSDEYRRTGRTNSPGGRASAGVECGSCHASVLPHGEDGPSDTSKRKVDRKLCVSCHNSERSPDYNEKTYLARVSHSTAVK